MGFIERDEIMGKNQHVTPQPGGWGVKGAGNTRQTVIKPTQKEAIAAAKELAIKQKSEVVIHGEDGKIREKNSYGNDPREIKG